MRWGIPQEERERGKETVCFTWSERDRNEYLLPSEDGKATVAHPGLHEVYPEHSYEKNQGLGTSS